MPHRDGSDTDFLSETRYRLNVLSGQFAASNVPLDEQSVLPRYRGLAWWGAVAFAAVLTAIGAVIDANLHSGLATAYQVLYLIGCVGAALLVRRRALFTAAVQPPLVAIVVSAITLYILNSSAQMSAKTLVFKLALPIASSFPSMAVTFVLTLAVVVARWYITRTRPTPAAGKTRKSGKASTAARPPRSAADGPARSKRTAKSSASSPRPRGESADRAADRRRTTLAEDDRAAQPARRRDDSAQATRTRRRADQPRPRPQTDTGTESARVQRARPSQPGAPVRRTAGAAARAAGLDLTAEFADQPAQRRRPPTPPTD